MNFLVFLLLLGVSDLYQYSIEGEVKIFLGLDSSIVLDVMD